VTLPPGLDDYACDKAGVSTKAGGVKFAAGSLPPLTVQDRFGVHVCTVKKEERICPPALPASNPAIHELSYALSCPGGALHATATVQDAFGSAPVVLAKPTGVLVPSGKIDLGPVPPAPPQALPPAPPQNVVDHYLCYKAKGPRFRPPLAVSVSDQFYPGGYPSATVAKLTRFCLPADTDGGDATAPGHLGHLTCYAMKLGVGTRFARTYVSTDNPDFGAQVLKVSGTAELCVPALATF